MIHQTKLRFGTNINGKSFEKKFFPSWEQNTFNVSGEKLTQLNLFQLLSTMLNLTQNVPEEKRIKEKTLEGRPMGLACEEEPGCPVSHYRPHRDLNLGHSSVSRKLSRWCECSIDNWGRNCPLQNEDKEVLRDYKCLHLALEECEHAPRTGNFPSTVPLGSQSRQQPASFDNRKPSYDLAHVNWRGFERHTNGKHSLGL